MTEPTIETAVTRTSERVLCEAHKGIHVESPECVWPHLVAPRGAQVQVGHPYRVTD